MVRNSLAVIIGIFCAMMIIGGIELVNSLSYPLPEAIRPMPDFSNPEHRQIMSDFIAKLPTQALVVVLVAHGLGAFLGSMVAAAISRRMTPAMLVGCFILLGGIMNLISVPGHPLWFGIADLALYLPMAYFGAILFAREAEVADADIDEDEEENDGVDEEGNQQDDAAKASDV